MSDDIRAVRRTANDTYDNLKKLYEWLKTLQRVTWTTSDGKKLTGYVELQLPSGTTTNYKYFGVTDITEDGNFQIRVNAGALAAADTAGIDSDPPTIGTLSKEYPVAGNDFSVVDGSKVYLKITTSSTDGTFDEYSSEGGEDDVNDLLTVETTVKSKSWTASAAEVIVQTGTPTPSDALSYRLLAEIEITGDVMIIKQRHDGAVEVPAVSAAFGDDPVLTGETEDHDICVDGVAETHRFVSMFID